MASVFDVAQYILQKQGKMTAMKLQKLVYYCQAWSLVWDEEPLFVETIEAWTNGPVVHELYEAHKGQFQLERLNLGDANNLTRDQRETIDAVLEAYSGKSAQWLSDLAHLEQPWNDARKGYSEGMPCINEISCESLAEYYGSLSPNGLPVNA